MKGIYCVKQICEWINVTSERLEFYLMVDCEGLEPTARWLRVSCSTNWANSPLYSLLPGASCRIRTRGLQIRSLSLYPAELRTHLLYLWGEWRDLNPQPPEPQSEALTKLRYIHHFSLLTYLLAYGALCRIRTRGLRLRRPLLYPAELRARS